MSQRSIEKIFPLKPTLEGAGVHLKRGFGYFEVPKFDPFLLFDDFSGEQEKDYVAGFPQHPHRGIETVTYMLKGEVHHRDNLGNQGSIRGGEIQWMTAGSGIIHEEMPQPSDEGIQGFQLWVNLPAKDKMMHPRYQEIKAPEIQIVREDGIEIRVIAGSYKETSGPVKDLMVSPSYFDVTLAPLKTFMIETPESHNFFAYIFEGRVMQREDRSEHWIGTGDIALFTKGKELTVTAGKDGARFLIVGGEPIDESISWQGPIVMNTDQELEVAFQELQTGTFIKN